MVSRFLAVLVAPVVAEPDIVAVIDESKGQTPLFFGETDPDLTIHQQAVVEVNDRLAGAVPSRIDSDAAILFSFSKWQPVYAKQISISCLDDMFFGIISEEFTQIGEV